MASLTNFKNFVNGIGLIPNASSPTVGDLRLGDLYTVSGSPGTLNFHNGSTASQVLTASHSANVTSKNFVGTTVLFVDSATNPKALKIDTSTMPNASKTATLAFLNDDNRIYTFPNAVADDTVVLRTTQQTLTNKTLTAPTIDIITGNGVGNILTLNATGAQGIQFQNAGVAVGAALSTGLAVPSGKTVFLYTTGNLTGVQLTAASSSANYTVTFPAAAPIANTYLKYDGTNYAWGTPASTILTNGVSSLTSNTTLVRTSDSGKLIAVNTTTGSFTVTLPASPIIGDNYYFKDTAGLLNTYPLTINPNGVSLEGSTSNYVVYAPYWSKMIYYTGSAYVLL